MTKEITVGESTKITLTLKSFFVALGIFQLIVVIAVWFILWYLGVDIKEATVPLMKKGAFEEWQKIKFDPHIDKFNELSIDVGVLLERTKNLPGNGNTSGRHNMTASVPPN